MRKLVIFLALVLVVAWSLPAFAIPGMGNPAWKVNVIGVPKDKKVPMTNDDRGTIFIPLNNNGDVPKPVKIQYVKGSEFAVLDGNGTDGLAKIQVPYETNGDLCFKVYAVALGKPGKQLSATVECSWTEPADTECVDSLYSGSFTVTRTKSTPTKDRVVDITDVFMVESVCFDLDDNQTFETCYNDIWIFNIPYLYQYFWDIENDGLKLMKLYFFEADCS